MIPAEQIGGYIIWSFIPVLVVLGLVRKYLLANTSFPRKFKLARRIYRAQVVLGILFLVTFFGGVTLYAAFEQFGNPYIALGFAAAIWLLGISLWYLIGKFWWFKWLLCLLALVTGLVKLIQMSF